MKYRRVVNRRLNSGDAPVDTENPVIAAPCWPEDASLPRIVERNGEIVLDEGWVRVDDEEPDPEAGV